MRASRTGSASGGGVLLNTDGSGRLNLFTAWNITNIAIGPTYYHAISNDGTRVMFYTQYGILPENAAFYVGYIDELNAATPSVADAPYISSITKAPGSMPRGDADAIVMFSIVMSDTDGLEDITNTAVDEMIDGLHYSSDEVPAYFSHGIPYDTGEGVDLVAGDGDFAAVAYPANLIDTVESMTVRISAMDAEKTVVIADTILTVTD
ncbi:MAG: hypothetical protein JSU63_01605 [Phycisphaerales bacterium]|nr:MAG: hypothetical protein JSU63_01605 [Phycisphaerales bacterium]